MNNSHPDKTNSYLFEKVVSILESARSNVIRSVNSEMVLAYWSIGREIVEEEQKGKEKAEYGKHLLKDLSDRLTSQYGKGFSATNLRYFRQFYLTYSDRKPEICHTVCDELTTGFFSSLSWSHYRALMRVDNAQARSFYESEAVKNAWSQRQLDRQINTLFFERLLKSNDKRGLLADINKKQEIEKPIDVLKDPYILEFLDIPASEKLVESDLENALISKLQDFLLELGNGFAYVGRQKRLTLDGDHFYPDLVFYHVKLKCYVVLDLKVGRLSHADLGQMQLYVNYYNREIRSEGDNPTIGLILCTNKNDAMVRYVLNEDNQQIFASRYKLALPSEDELIKELKHEVQQLEGLIDESEF